MIFGMTYLNIAWYFLFYSFAGWCVEVVYHAVKQGRVVNRGFLCGPVCPVYGFGMLAVFSMTKSVIPAATGISEAALRSEDNLAGTLVIFIGGMILTTSVELIAGWLLDIAFHARWWDYSAEPLNFHGYICVRFSIIWGCAVVAVVRIVQPLMERGDAFEIPAPYVYWVLGGLYAVYFSDFVLTVMIVAGLNRRLRELDEMQRQMRRVSDALSETLGTGTIRTQQGLDESRVKLALARAEIKDGISESRRRVSHAAAVRKAAFSWDMEKRKRAVEENIADLRQTAGSLTRHSRRKASEIRTGMERRAEELTAELAGTKAAYAARAGELRAKLASHPLFGPGRLLKAFPGMKHRDYRELLEKLK